MALITEKRLATLPKWAQDHIETLERKANDANARLARLGGNLGDDGLYATQGWGDDLHVLPIGDYHVVLRSEGHNIIRVRPTDDGKGLDINTGVGTAIVLPQAGNSLVVKNDPDWKLR